MLSIKYSVIYLFKIHDRKTLGLLILSEVHKIHRYTKYGNVQIEKNNHHHHYHYFVLQRKILCSTWLYTHFFLHFYIVSKNHNSSLRSSLLQLRLFSDIITFYVCWITSECCPSISVRVVLIAVDLLPSPLINVFNSRSLGIPQTCSNSCNFSSCFLFLY